MSLSTWPALPQHQAASQSSVHLPSPACTPFSKTLFPICSWRIEVTKSLRWNWRFNPAPLLGSQCWSRSSPTWFPVCCKERTAMQDCSTAGVNWRGLLQNILQWGFSTALPPPRPCQCTESFVNLLFQEEFAIIRNTWTEKKNIFCLLEIMVMS